MIEILESGGKRVVFFLHAKPPRTSGGATKLDGGTR